MSKRVFFTVWVLSAALAQAAPPPGHPSTDQAAKALGVPTDQPLLFEGRVLEAIDSNSYTYIQVQVSADEQLWLAAPRLALAPGAVIRFGRGTLMQNFYSKKLKRQFSQVLFVDRVAIKRPGP
ncbi:hypothetical protein [Motiliproteus sp. SC1-56]|uniref:hypothetical protein n=1 Tax=Motiliproteus sp. SC1-56 TaxID=2799565 RepID=UPI001A9075B8|nr:hypothetical protein [Motiliproteus sp. SC1-56]